jgi:hypothetical protein
MTDSLQARLAAFTEAELRQYLQRFEEYRTEAVEAALAELERRGLSLPGEERARLQAGLEAREEAARERLKHSFVAGLGDTLAQRLQRIRQLTLGLLVAGLGTAMVVYQLTAPKAPNPLGYEPEDTKKYLRDLELYGGKVNVLATEVMRWWDGLWQGRNLAYTLATLTALLALAFWLIATWRARDLEAP